ncbi:NAD(P)/FAD-dependent oxidoreductase [Clostridium sp. SYSU_GA19001]|uniref:NAD(P)/FAD-dependent oxidoreductase n=1 Tax=Clostridium caldaquaticum TaxID=2940653 RepID=UPI002077055D|nr:NAD(P)/FAD-dependent oxidoreductase [Clostridium caldaquaticum]MCM8711563.1 NAD(P)/FAD-dependent oxidoreductase [Clostridium caldaquaticum]
MKHDLIIIGGGAAGIMAAITAKDMGADAAILEGSDRVGKKLLTTGNGRCNITNKYIENSKFHSENPEFFKRALEEFKVSDTINFFSSLGLPLITLEEGRMYPMSLQASSVLDIMRLALADKDIPVYLNSKVKSIKTIKAGFKIETLNGDMFECHKLLLTCGGKAAPSTGSDGSGYALAKALGHNIINPVPALVQLKLDYKNLKALAGVKFNGIAEIYVDGHLKRREFGEILFTDYGISGPPILQLSRIASYSLSKGKEVLIKVEILYTMKEEELENFFEGHFSIFGHRSVHDSFIGIINKKLIPILLKEAQITDIHKACWNLSYKEKKNIYALLKNWKFKVTDTNSWGNAQVTAGGVDTMQINAETMESKLVPNLYFAGEILDVDGDCGGFNLQWAWSSAYLAAKNASKS